MYERGELQQRILEVLSKEHELHISQICPWVFASDVKGARQYVYQSLKSLVKRGDVIRVHRGAYRLANT
jgi:Fe2+ or Zn2+ uptake regulation protein